MTFKELRDRIAEEYNNGGETSEYNFGYDHAIKIVLAIIDEALADSSDRDDIDECASEYARFLMALDDWGCAHDHPNIVAEVEALEASGTSEPAKPEPGDIVLYRNTPFGLWHLWEFSLSGEGIAQYIVLMRAAEVGRRIEEAGKPVVHPLMQDALDKIYKPKGG